MSTVKERLKEFIKFKGITMKSFEERCGLSTGYVTSMRKGFGERKLNNVLKAFPELNRDWLLFGEGEMLKSAPIRHIHNVKEGAIATQVDNSPVNKLVNEKDLILLLQKKDEQIDRLLSIIEKISLKQIKI